MRRFFSLVTLVFALLLIPSAAQEQATFDSLVLGEWEQIVVEDGVCLYGDEYSFFVRPAETPTAKLMIYFQGGGACWDAFTCASVGQFASQYDVSSTETSFYQAGYFDFDNPNNPVSDYNMVFLPYCTGDIYSGDNVVTYAVPEAVESDAEELTINYNGFDNAQAVLDWVYANFAAPEQVFVTGCSAGGYGATTHAPFIMQNYADVPVVHLADSATGVNRLDWEGLLTWNLYENLPAFVEDMAGVEHGEFSTSLQFTTTSAAFPDNIMAQYNTFLDGVQVGFYGLTALGTPVDETNFLQVAEQWTPAMLGNVRGIEGEVDNFAYYTAGGAEHCIVNRDIFYDYEVDGVVFRDWVASLLGGDTSDISCNAATGACLQAPNG